MDFDWDPAKARSNRRKHGIDFADAALVLLDEFALTVQDTAAGEVRHVTLGTDPRGRVLVVVYSWRDERVRIISARRATRSERRRYEGTP